MLTSPSGVYVGVAHLARLVHLFPVSQDFFLQAAHKYEVAVRSITEHDYFNLTYILEVEGKKRVSAEQSC